jgi:NCAIR mutase (PurE)-related protein
LPLDKEKYLPEDELATSDWLTRLLEKLRSGELSITQAVKELSVLPYEELHFAKIDHHRSLRTGFPEVIYGRGKSVEQIVAIASRMAVYSDRILITHTSQDVYNAVHKILEDACYNPTSNTIVVNRAKNILLRPGICVVTAGTSDIPVAEEAAVTAELMGNRVEKIFDIGIAGIHRLLDNLGQLRESRVLVVVAGMEGALPGVIGGIVPVPIIAVPTSTGYGASFNGLAPLLTMLNSCAPGIAVVNIDNGFGAGYLAGLINMRKSGTANETDGD